jgi:hypothetical protein
MSETGLTSDDVTPPLVTGGIEPPLLSHASAGRRQRAFETVITAGFISVCDATL